ncbi:MAG: serine hydrolase domain-containing protein [Saccharofermentanales bacterium]
MDFNRLTDYIDSLGQYGIPGCDCAVYHRHQPVFRHMQGFSDAGRTVPVSGNDFYWLFSATKLFTCAAAMQLTERGLLGLDDPIRQYLPAFTEMMVRSDAGLVSVRNPITVRSLMTMTAGLDYNVQMPSILEVRQLTGNQATTREIVDAIAKEPLSFEPSSHYQYSLCHDVLGAVIEAAAGQSLGEYLRMNIFEPLGISSATFRMTDDVRSRLTATYMYNNDTRTSESISSDNGFILSDCYESGGAGLLCTAGDYIRFADALANGGVGANGIRILSEDSIDRMRHNELDDICYEDFKKLGKTGYSYGLGVRTIVDRSASRSPVGEFGWDGAAGCYVMIDPINHIAIFYAQQVHNCGYAFNDIHPAIRDLTYECLGI